MTEEFLHHVWKFKLFSQANLLTTGNDEVEIVKAGDHNSDAGPDFFNAKIRVGETLWAGNVEVHINSSDWKKHRHQHDKAYDNIILHVVNNADERLFRSNGEEIPTIEIRDRIDRKLIHNYMHFRSTAGWIPCAGQVNTAPAIVLNGMIDKLVPERLEKKSGTIIKSLELNQNNWEETFYQALARNFGFKTNAEPFELLAKSLPSLVLARHRSSRLQIEAMLFGQAGMLDQHFDDPYPQTLQNEYMFLRQKFRLEPIDRHLWKFLRLRPVNFPPVRIAQFADLICRSSHLFSKMLEAGTVQQLKELLCASVSEYWQTHYLFDKRTVKRSKELGDESVNNIIINTIVPFLFVYGKQTREEAYVERALKLLEETEAEQNNIITGWKKLGLPVENASASQGLLQLKNEYCARKKCLSSNIGNYLLKNS